MSDANYNGISFDKMSKADLAHAYNTMAFEMGLKEVSSFRTREDGIRRVRELAERRESPNGETTEAAGLEEEKDEMTIQDDIRAGEDDPVMALPEDPAEARDQLHREFGDEDLPAPSEEKAPTKEATEKKSKGGTPRKREVKPIEGVELADPTDPNAVYAAIGAKEGTAKANLARLLCDFYGKDLAIEEMVRATYGHDASVEEKKGALLGGVLVGIEVAIERRKLPVRVVRSRGGTARIEPIEAE